MAFPMANSRPSQLLSFLWSALERTRGIYHADSSVRIAASACLFAVGAAALTLVSTASTAAEAPSKSGSQADWIVDPAPVQLGMLCTASLMRDNRLH